MKLYEDMVSEYLTANGLAFVCPQFRADRTPFGEASVAEPDFVVIDFEKKDVAVVEVSAAYNLDVLFQKIRNRHQRWYEPIHHKLLSTNTIRPDWPGGSRNHIHKAGVGRQWWKRLGRRPDTGRRRHIRWFRRCRLWLFLVPQPLRRSAEPLQKPHLIIGS